VQRVEGGGDDVTLHFKEVNFKKVVEEGQEGRWCMEGERHLFAWSEDEGVGGVTRRDSEGDGASQADGTCRGRGGGGGEAGEVPRVHLGAEGDAVDCEE